MSFDFVWTHIVISVSESKTGVVISILRLLRLISLAADSEKRFSSLQRAHVIFFARK